MSMREEKLLRSYIDPFVPQCGYPRVVGQTPAPGTKATVGDLILVDVAPENP